MAVTFIFYLLTAGWTGGNSMISQHSSVGFIQIKGAGLCIKLIMTSFSEFLCSRIKLRPAKNLIPRRLNCLPAL